MVHRRAKQRAYLLVYLLQDIRTASTYAFNNGFELMLKNKKMNPYNYVIIKNNYPELERESTLLHNNYKKTKKYAFICKGINKDHSENIYFIDYSNDLELLQNKASKYVSWYNYPLNLTKNIQGYISELN